MSWRRGTSCCTPCSSSSRQPCSTGSSRDEPASLARARIVASSWTQDQQGRRHEEMSLCLQCGHPTSAGRDLCSHHDSCHADDWATGNRIMCDFLHRRIDRKSTRLNSSHGYISYAVFCLKKKKKKKKKNQKQIH